VAVFKSFEELYELIGALYDEAKLDAQVAPKIRDSKMVIQFRYDDPLAIVTINAASPPTPPNPYFDVLWGEQPQLKVTVEMSMKADVAHHFWHGKVNLMTALTRRQIIAKGPIPKILALLPSVSPMYKMYPRILREKGREDLILK
jgi:hypothetical protein